MIDIKKLTDDFLGLGSYIDVPNSKKLTGGESVNILKYSGLVSVVNRRSSRKIAAEWSKNFGKKKNYDSKLPAVIARQTYTAETIQSELDLKNKSLVDLGAGEGNFLEILKSKKTLKNLLGVEPSSENCRKIKKRGIKSFKGTIEDFSLHNTEKFDAATLLWTLCNCSHPINIIKSASKALKKNGFIIVAEGSRILVPYKKPIQMYFGKKQAPDMHPFHFSKNSLINLLALNKFKIVYINRYIDSEYLLVIAKKTNIIQKKYIKLDNYKIVKKFFKNWYNHSLNYKKEIIPN
tara:strand:+ start:86 stop:961 length:876 start_codon:yes stop_codon:yes gene_type:complete